MSFTPPVNTTVTSIKLELKQFVPDNTKPELQLKQVEGEFVHVLQLDVQGTQLTGAPAIELEMAAPELV